MSKKVWMNESHFPRCMLYKNILTFERQIAFHIQFQSVNFILVFVHKTSKVWQYDTYAELGWSDRKKIRSQLNIRSWCNQGSFFSNITDHDLIWLQITFYDDLIKKPDHFPDHFSFICHYLKGQFSKQF